MIDLSNIDDVSRERVLLTLSYNRFTPIHIADSATYSVSVPIAEINTQSTDLAKIATKFINTVYKLVASFITGSAYPDGGIGGTGHVQDDAASVHDRADFIVVKAYQDGGIGGTGNAPDNAEFSRFYIGQLDKHINDVIAPGGMSGTGHVDDDAVFLREDTGGIVMTHVGGGIVGTGHTLDPVASDMLTDVALGSVKGNNASPATNYNPVLDNAIVVNSSNKAKDKTVTDQTIGGVDDHQQLPADVGLSGNQPDIMPDIQLQAITDGVSEDMSIIVDLLFDSSQLLSNRPDDVDTDIVVESIDFEILTLPAYMYESLNEFNQGSAQSVIC